MTSRQLHLGVSLDGAGAHPGAWQLPGIAESLLDPARLVQLAHTAERGLLDFVALDDSYDPPVGTSVPFRLDALLSLARVAPATSSIGLLATVTTTHTEPFHTSKNVATLDLVSGGRGAWRVAVSTSPEAAARFGRKGVQPLDELWEEAGDSIEAVARLWDSWEDDAVIRDQPTGRYLDRNKVHYVDFEGRFFSVRGPSITPRSPQGQPLVAIAADDPFASAVAAARADLIIVNAFDADTARQRREALRSDIESAGRNPDDVAILIAVNVGEDVFRNQLGSTPVATTLDLVGSANHVAEVLGEWFSSDAADGFLLLPDALPHTLDWLVDAVVPVLQQAGTFRNEAPVGTLRDRFGLARPQNRYAEVAP